MIFDVEMTNGNGWSGFGFVGWAGLRCLGICTLSTCRGYGCDILRFLGKGCGSAIAYTF
jgi:hypothetical protein